MFFSQKYVDVDPKRQSEALHKELERKTEELIAIIRKRTAELHGIIDTWKTQKENKVGKNLEIMKKYSKKLLEVSIFFFSLFFSFFFAKKFEGSKIMECEIARSKCNDERQGKWDV